MNKAVFLDRDGTINIDKSYLYKIEDFEFIPGALNGMALLQQAGYKLLIVTNQSGIARGFYTEEQFQNLNKWMLQTLEERNIHIDHIYYCPHLPNAPIARYRKDCICRKPKLGMYFKAINDYQLDLDESFSIGDKLRDCSICESTQCRGFLIGNSEDESIINKVKNGEIHNVDYASSLLEAAERIVRTLK